MEQNTPRNKPIYVWESRALLMNEHINDTGTNGYPLRKIIGLDPYLTLYKNINFR
jgi:hypothetical protein